MSYNLGWTIAPTLGGLVIYTFGWHWMFWADGLTCFAAAIFLWITIKEQKREAIQPQTEAQPAHPAPSPFHDRKYMFFLLMTVLGAVVFMQVIWIVPVFFKEVYGWNEAQIGWITALNGIIVVLVEMPLVFKIERKGRTLDWVKIGLILYAVSYAMFAIFPANFGLIASVLFMIFLSFGEIFVMPFSNTWVTLRAGEQKRGKYMALYTMAYSVSNILAPMIGTQVIAHWGYNTLWYLLLVITAFSWAGMWYLSQRVAPAALIQKSSI
jgi:predicted MFS family arabinose efflux permease